jgi:nucleotide-binding universal stress UspA family protein
MTSITFPMTDPSVSPEPLALSTGPVMIATDGEPDSDAAFPLAQVLASHMQTNIEAVSVLGSYATSLFTADVLPVSAEQGATVRLDREARVRAQVARLMPSDTPVIVQVREGDTAHVLIDHADTHDVRVILVGRGRHKGLRRLVGAELLVRLLHIGDRPILAVDPELKWLPRRIVIGMDFSDYSLHAARIALTMIAPGAEVFLVNVGPDFAESDPTLRDRAVAYRRQAQMRMARIREALDHPAMRLEEVFLKGNAAEALLTYAEEVQADLIVSSTHGHGFIRRMLLGSVASGLLRAAQCSVLCVPGSARSHAAAYARRARLTRTRAFSPGQEDAELAVFTTRNAGKPCTVLVHQPELGAQSLGHSLRLVGATYDTHQRAVSLMFGAPQLAGSHLTHSMSGVSRIDLSTDHEGHDSVLRLDHGLGYTLVALE